jgi:hypothetical protein
MNFDQLSASGHYSNSVIIIRFCINLRNKNRALPVMSVLLRSGSKSRGIEQLHWDGSTERTLPLLLVRYASDVQPQLAYGKYHTRTTTIMKLCKSKKLSSRITTRQYRRAGSNNAAESRSHCIRMSLRSCALVYPLSYIQMRY